MAQPQGAETNPYFVPAGTQIAAITNSFPTTITTTFAHGYLTGAIVRLYIPKGWGMDQANYLKAPITVTSTTQFTMPIDTTTFDPFVVPTYVNPPAPYTTAQVIPVGEQTPYLNSSFMNILTPLY